MTTPTTKVLVGDCIARLQELPDGSVQTCITSPPYWGLRDYGHDGQLGLEPTPEEYVAKMVEVFREVSRVLRDDGTLWLNLGDSYNNRCTARKSSHQTGLGFQSEDLAKSWSALKGEGRTRMSLQGGEYSLKEKDLVGIPWRVAFALQADGWYIRSDIIWHKPNPMPESVTDRPTKSHEYVFLLTKSPKYYFDSDAVREPTVTPIDGRGSTEQRKALGDPTRYGMASRGEGWSMPSISAPEGGRNKRSVWTVTTKPYSGAHFATMPEELVEPCVLAGSKPGDTVLDPFGGAGTTGLVANKWGRNAILCELNPEYVKIIESRIAIGLGEVASDREIEEKDLPTSSLAGLLGFDE